MGASVDKNWIQLVHHFPLLLQSFGVHLIHFESILIFLFTIERAWRSSTSLVRQIMYWPL